MEKEWETLQELIDKLDAVLAPAKERETEERQARFFLAKVANKRPLTDDEFQFFIGNPMYKLAGH